MLKHSKEKIGGEHGEDWFGVHYYIKRGVASNSKAWKDTNNMVHLLSSNAMWIINDANKLRVAAHQFLF